MSLQIIQHIKIKDDNPLTARMVGRGLKVYMVANLAFIDGAESSAEHYNLSLGAVYAAMSFYEDNREGKESFMVPETQGDLQISRLLSLVQIREHATRSNH